VFDNTIAFEMKMEIFELDAKVASLNFCRNYKTRELSRIFLKKNRDIKNFKMLFETPLLQ